MGHPWKVRLMHPFRVAVLLFAAVGCDEADGSGLDRADSASAVDSLIAQVRAMEDAHREGYRQLDTAAIGRLLAEDYRTNAIAAREFRDRNYALQAILDHPASRPIISIEHDINQIRVYGDVAVVTGFGRVWYSEEEPNSPWIPYTHIWNRENERWELVSRHFNRLPE